MLATLPWHEQIADHMQEARGLLHEQVEARIRAETRVAALEHALAEMAERVLAAEDRAIALDAAAQKHGATLRAMNLALLRVSAWHTAIAKGWPGEASNGT